MTVLANVMIPTIAEHVVIMLVLLIPVTMIEAVVIMRRHFLKYPESLKLSFLANLISTIVGLPIGYVFALLGIIPAGLFTMLLPKNIGSAIGIILGNAIFRGGTIPNKLDEVGFYLGTLIVMVPYFLVTLLIERKVIAKHKPELDTPVLTKTVLIMNSITYGLLALPVVIGAINAVIKFYA
jgi:hypothetical protein